jgi:hypothetical protein
MASSRTSSPAAAATLSDTIRARIAADACIQS